MKPQSTNFEVRSPFDGHVVGLVPLTPAEALPEIVASSQKGAALVAALPRHKRAELLQEAASLVERQVDDFARTIAMEAGKTIRQARKEVARCINTLRLSAEEAKRHGGEIIPFDAYAGAEDRSGYYTHEPLGVILAITPFNDPLNLVAHKLGPALAAGNAVILKPSLLAPLSAKRLVECLWQAGVPRGALQIVYGNRNVTEPLLREKTIRMVSFTGGPVSGEAITRTAGLKKMAMDLGGNAPVLVMADCDLKDAAEACVSGAFWAAGQNCIGTQRILVARSVYQNFTRYMVELTESMSVGDPLSEVTDMGPMISEEQAKRIEGWVDEAVSQGATVLTGHQREGALYYPTILANVPTTAKVWREEVFAPVVIITPFDSLDQALESANDSESSLQAGIFTSHLETALSVAERLQAGGVMVNDSSDFRFDGMPFGGFKYGSLGREGVRFTITEMSQPKVVCFRRKRSSLL
ncbi:aldehyde dehydrogenase family protein [Crenobacter sp. SG2303]|uniref:Aldehyde dehydrogenase family protein n=1 Tax=Crenobacter oryzisoli TaxID=3056844 RepID=A0ABT7XSB1_9NEIS|nr:MULTISPECIES: aldehyde dehydrogenase family protein [unclassified Crenobacter]MDN0076696.1 aldehyde dehydrogenase family protein [Crenobacter sp. SG2303]MDN0085537.1 aldehyde dehydrogenase family protein [Crenobacter sp. SG2305]